MQSAVAGRQTLRAASAAAAGLIEMSVSGAERLFVPRGRKTVQGTLVNMQRGRRVSARCLPSASFPHE